MFKTPKTLQESQQETGALLSLLAECHGCAKPAPLHAVALLSQLKVSFLN